MFVNISHISYPNPKNELRRRPPPQKFLGLVFLWQKNKKKTQNQKFLGGVYAPQLIFWVWVRNVRNINKHV
ncbi:MAG: hypothetical protein ACK5S8_10715, partial [Pseudanabaena sp.]